MINESMSVSIIPMVGTCQLARGDECSRPGLGQTDVTRVSLRATTELFSARIDQLYQFIYDHGLEPPPMKPDDESAMNRVLDTLQITRQPAKRNQLVDSGQVDQPTTVPSPPFQSPVAPTGESLLPPVSEATMATSSQTPVTNPTLFPTEGLGFRNPQPNPYPTNWGFALPTAQSLDAFYADLNGSLNEPNLPVDTGPSPDSLHLSQDMAQQPGVLLEQAQHEEHDSDSDEEDEAENDVIEQISNRIGTLKIAGDGHLRFYGATSNLNLVDVSATQQRQRPDARSVRHDGQDILNHLRVGQPVDQALEDHLVELYFTWQNPSTYVVDKEMFMIARSKWRNEFDDTPFYSEVLTNAMYAPIAGVM